MVRRPEVEDMARRKGEARRRGEGEEGTVRRKGEVMEDRLKAEVMGVRLKAEVMEVRRPGVDMVDRLPVGTVDRLGTAARLQAASVDRPDLPAASAPSPPRKKVLAPR
jgi:hypothetical protein